MIEKLRSYFDFEFGVRENGIILQSHIVFLITFVLIAIIHMSCLPRVMFSFKKCYDALENTSIFGFYVRAPFRTSRQLLDFIFLNDFKHVWTARLDIFNSKHFLRCLSLRRQSLRMLFRCVHFFLDGVGRNTS